MSTNPNQFGYLPLTGGTITGNLSITGHLQAVPGTAPGAVAGGNAGTTPPAPAVTTGSMDNAGTITFGTGTTPSAGAMVSVTFATAWVIPGGGAPHIALTPGNTATQALGLFVSGVSPTGFIISVTTAPAASQGNTVYSVNYVIDG